MASSSFISTETNFCTPSESKIFFFRNRTFSLETDRINAAPLAIVLATSNDRMDILFPRDTLSDMNPLADVKLDILLPIVSKTSTAFSRPAVPALPKMEVISGAYIKFHDQKNNGNINTYILYQ